MDGTFLAPILALALGYLLSEAQKRGPQPKDAAKTEKRRSDRYVTVEELEERLSEERKKTEWANEEWYEKFSTLHARLAKRESRRKKKDEELGEEEELELEERPPSVLDYRREGSV